MDHTPAYYGSMEQERVPVVNTSSQVTNNSRITRSNIPAKNTSLQQKSPLYYVNEQEESFEEE